MFDFNEPVGFTIFCDDIRQEVGGKTSLIGIYNGVMLIHSTFPATLPKFGFRIEFLEPAQLALERDFTVEFRIYLPGDEDDEPSLLAPLEPEPEQARAALENLPPPTGQRLVAHVISNLVATPFVLKEPGMIRVRAKYKDNDLRCGSLRVIPASGEEAEASPKPE
jgi:hypothetical protein